MTTSLATLSPYRQDISIEVVTGGFILDFTDLATGIRVREVHVSQRKLINRLKDIIADSSLVPEPKED